MRFTGRQITTMIVAVCVAIIAFPVGVYAATGSLVNITDPVTKANKARVDASGRLKVGDGSGVLTVDGTVTSRPAPPTRAWHYAEEQAGPSDVALPVTASTINITSLTVTASFDNVPFRIAVLRMAGTATNCTGTIQSVQDLYLAQHLVIGAPLTVSFPTPLQARPPSGQKLCLTVFGPSTSVSLSGYYS